MRKFIIYNWVLFIILICFPAIGKTQPLTITVKEKGTGVAIAEATVVLIDKSTTSDDVTHAQTNDFGKAKFNLTLKPAKIKALAPGYQTQIQNIKSAATNITVYLLPNEIQGEAVVVVADRIVEKGSKISLTAQELTDSAGSLGDPLKALGGLPGITPVGEGSSEVYMRGSDGNDNIIWVNRAPVGYLYHFGGFQSTIHPALVEDINIFLGGFPVEYGNALGGVIDVKLRAPNNTRTEYQIDVSTISASFLMQGPVDNSNDAFFVSGRRSYIDAIISPEKFNENVNDKEEEDPDQITLVPRFYDFQSLYRHQLKKGYIDTYLFAAGDELAMDIIGSAKSDPQLSGQLNGKAEFQTLGMTWQHNINHKLNQIMTLALYHDKDQTRLGQDENGKPFYINTESTSLFWQPELMYKQSSKNNINFGLSASYEKSPVDLNITRPPNENDISFDFTTQEKLKLKKTIIARSFDPYIKLRTQWSNKFNSSIGLYYSNISVTGGYTEQELSPRLNTEYQLTDKTLLTASWGKFIQTPDASQIIKVFGNPALEVTESEHRIIGVQHKLSDLYSFKTEIYQKPMKNLVISLDDNSPPDNYANKGTGEAYGIDIFFKRESRDRKFGWISLSLSDSERTNEVTQVNRKFSGDQPIRITAVWGQPLNLNWDWSIKAEFHSGTPYTEITGRFQEDPNNANSRWIAEYGDHNAQRTPDYFKLDMRFSRRFVFNESKVKLYFDIQNITNTKNIIEYDYGNEFEKIENPREITGMALFAYFGVEVKF
jgi:TonB-dependent receptor-like protein